MSDLMQRELELPVTPQTLWQAITDEAWLTHWLADDAQLQLWPGGDARFQIGDERRRGWVEEVTPPAADGPGRLAFWWEAADDEGDGHASRVCLELIPTPDGTRLRVIETRPLEVLDLVGTPLAAPRGLADPGAERFGPALVAA